MLRLTLLQVAPGQDRSQVVQTRLFSAAELQAGAALVVDTAKLGAGAYRAEVTVIPLHLAHLLGPDPTPYLHEFPYLYSGVIYVDPSPRVSRTAGRRSAAQ